MVKNDSRIFFYGNGTNIYNFTGLANGVPSAEYFPANNYREIGSDEFEIMDIIRQYDRQVILTSGGEAFYSYYEPIDDVLGNVIADFPTAPINSKVGSIAKGQGRLVRNNPFAIDRTGIHEWTATNVRDERNEQNISHKIQNSLNKLDLSTAVTHICDKVSEYWVAIGKQIFMYNFELKVWFMAELYDSPTCFYNINGIVHFGTANGQIMRFNPNATSDNGHPKDFYWEMSFYDFEAQYLEKYMNEILVSLKPESLSGLKVEYQTNKDAIKEAGIISYNLFNFGNVNFGNYTFLTSYDPQPFKLRVNINRFVYLKNNTIKNNSRRTNNNFIYHITL